MVPSACTHRRVIAGMCVSLHWVGGWGGRWERGGGGLKCLKTRGDKFGGQRISTKLQTNRILVNNFNF